MSETAPVIDCRICGTRLETQTEAADHLADHLQNRDSLSLLLDDVFNAVERLESEQEDVCPFCEHGEDVEFMDKTGPGAEYRTRRYVCRGCTAERTGAKWERPAHVSQMPEGDD